MTKLKIKSMDGIFGKDYASDFEKFGLKIGDVIDAIRFTSNSFWYQPIKDGEVLFIYQHNVDIIDK